MLSLVLSIMKKKGGTDKAPLPCKTSYATQVAPQHFLVLHEKKQNHSGLVPDGWPYFVGEVAPKFRNEWTFRPEYTRSAMEHFF